MPAIKPEQLYSDLKTGRLGMVYLFDGPEDFLKDQAIEKITGRLVPTESRDFNLERFDGKTCSGGEIISAIQSLPWMGDRRLVIVQSADEITTADGRLIAETLSNLPASTCLVFVYEGKANLREEIPAQVMSLGQVITFWTPFPNQLPMWVTSHAKQMGKTISYDAAQCLADSCSDLHQIVNELNKLFLFVGAKKNIDLVDIKNHGLPDQEGDFKDLEEALWTRSTTEALRQGQLLTGSGVRLEMLLPAFERVFKTLLLGQSIMSSRRIPAEEAAADLGIRGKTNQQNFQKGLKSYTNHELRGSLAKVVKADYELKTGQLPSEIGLSLLIWNLLGKEKAESVFR